MEAYCVAIPNITDTASFEVTALSNDTLYKWVLAYMLHIRSLACLLLYNLLLDGCKLWPWMRVFNIIMLLMATP